MPRKNDTKVPEKAVAKAVKRRLAGESAGSLAKEYKVSRATLYNWTAAYKQQLLDQSKLADLSPGDAEKADKQVLMAENEALKREVRKLRDKVVSMMIKAGEI